jgi:hypothetical protein
MRRLLRPGIVISLAAAGLLTVACLVVNGMVVRHDQDVRIYSVTPDGTVQVIGMRHRTYLLDYGGEHAVVLFHTTFGTGVHTRGPEEDARPAERDSRHGQ